MNLMKTALQKPLLNVPLAVTLAASVFALAACSRAEDKPAAKETEPLKLQLPAPTLKGTPEDMPVGPNIEPISDKPRPAFLVPKGAKNVSAGKTVTSSVNPF